MIYCEAVHQSKRRNSRVVRIGTVDLGGDNPVRIQSMTTTPTRDVQATVDQIMQLADQGCEIVRVTVQGKKEAEACEQIKNSLLRSGYSVPLVADIHFYPPAALLVADFVDKVRINPGNFADKRATFQSLDFSEQAYASELERIEEKFVPLVQKCKRLGRAMRIGTNHGSLSDRIMSRYGDTPRGMLESALEYARICRKYDYHNLVFSMKSSNVQVMVQAYRLLVAEMMRLGWDYPLHLGVTEAGEGEDGRVKSAMGIGALLLDGLGDTLRVSLTEDPWREVDPARRLADFAHAREGVGIAPFSESHRSSTSFQRRRVKDASDAGVHPLGAVFIAVDDADIAEPDFVENLRLKDEEARVDALLIRQYPRSEALKARLRHAQAAGVALVTPARVARGVRLLTLEQLRQERQLQASVERFAIRFPVPPKEEAYALLLHGDEEDLNDLAALDPSYIILEAHGSLLHMGRRLAELLQAAEVDAPVIWAPSYIGAMHDLVIQASAEVGALLVDGLGEGLCLQAPLPLTQRRDLSFAVLQAARMRSTKTEFISCPSCGRTLFDLQEVTQRIKKRTEHLAGVKIAIMGCIVNGPGEMADADFGYVGSKAGMIDLYVGRDCVERNIPFAQADERLVDLIKTHGRWVEPGRSDQKGIQHR